MQHYLYCNIWKICFDICYINNNIIYCFFFLGETSLFLYRLCLDLSYPHVAKSFQELLQYFVTKNNDSELLTLLKKIIDKNLIRHYFDKHRKDEFKFQTNQFQREEDCGSFNVDVCFQLLPKLVASRSVVIKRFSFIG